MQGWRVRQQVGPSGAVRTLLSIRQRMWSKYLHRLSKSRDDVPHSDPCSPVQHDSERCAAAALSAHCFGMYPRIQNANRATLPEHTYSYDPDVSFGAAALPLLPPHARTHARTRRARPQAQVTACTITHLRERSQARTHRDTDGHRQTQTRTRTHSRTHMSKGRGRRGCLDAKSGAEAGAPVQVAFEMLPECVEDLLGVGVDRQQRRLVHVARGK